MTLYRKGRLIAKYKFRKLSVEKANELANHLESVHRFEAPMTLTDIFNYEGQAYPRDNLRAIGF